MSKCAIDLENRLWLCEEILHAAKHTLSHEKALQMIHLISDLTRSEPYLSDVEGQETVKAEQVDLGLKRWF